MSLTTVNWKRVAGVTPSANTIPAILDALYSAGTAATYWDGTARTQGAGSAGTWSRYQNGATTEAVYCTPVTAALAHRYIFGGATGAKTPTMATPDTWAINNVLAGLAKNAGAYNAWDNAAPFTSGQFYGYWRALGTASFTVSRVHIIESQECAIVVFEATTGACQFVGIGALLDPETSTGTSAESDGRRYSMWVSASAAATNATFLETNTSTTAHSVAASSYHHMVADIGAVATFVTVNKYTLLAAQTATSGVNASSEAAVMPIAFYRTAAAPNDNWIGVTRQFGACKNTLSMVTRQLTGVDVWHYVGASTASVGNSMGFKV